MSSIGPLDPRRRTHRCQQCCISRTKCYGGRPCLACTSRQRRCIDQPASTTTQFRFLPIQEQAACRELATGQVKSDTEYVSLFYEFLGNQASPVTQVFFSPYFRAIIHEEACIRNAAVAIGIAYACRNQRLLSKQPTAENLLLTELHQQLHTKLEGQMQGPHFDTNNLNLAVLAGILELMISLTGSSWLSLIDQLTRWIVNSRAQNTFTGQPDRSFLLIFELFHVFSALIRDNDSAFANVQCYSPFRIDNLGPSTFQSEDSFQHLETVCTILHGLARMNARCLSWLDDERNIFHSSVHSAAGACELSESPETRQYREHIRHGREIAELASNQLNQLRLCKPCLVVPEPTSGAHCDLFSAIYHCLTIGIVRLFAHPLWHIAPFSIPVIADEDIQAHALAALEFLEAQVQSAGLEAFLYLPQLMIISLETRDSANRSRIMTLFLSIKAKGFNVAEAYILDVELIWRAV